MSKLYFGLKILHGNEDIETKINITKHFYFIYKKFFSTEAVFFFKKLFHSSTDPISYERVFDSTIPEHDCCSVFVSWQFTYVLFIDSHSITLRMGTGLKAKQYQMIETVSICND